MIARAASAACVWLLVIGTARAQEQLPDPPPPPQEEEPPPPAPPPPPPPPDAIPEPPPGYGTPPPATPPQEPAPPPYAPAPATPPGVYAGPAGTAPAARPVPTGVQEHDGFYLRATLGPAYLSTAGDGSLDFSASGGGLSFSVAIGGAVATNLVIYGVLYGAGAAGPTYEAGGASVETGSDVTLSYGGLGVGLSYFLMPANVYFAGSIALVNAQLESELETIITDSKVGFGARLLVGKEFWISDNWGIGFAGELMLGSSSGGLAAGSAVDTKERFTTFGAGVHFSATYN